MKKKGKPKLSRSTVYAGYLGSRLPMSPGEGQKIVNDHIRVVTEKKMWRVVGWPDVEKKNLCPFGLRLPPLNPKSP